MESTNQNNTTESSLLQNRLLSDAITAHELRIGNILSVGLYTVKVVEIQNKGVHVCDLEETQDTWELFDDRIKGIPLTEDLLQKFGFTEVPSEYQENHPWSAWVLEGVVISMPYFDYCFNEGQYEIQIKSVHQLQNLFFALTGQELQVFS